MEHDIESSEKRALTGKGADEVDFSSGYETQYAQEYRPKKNLPKPSPPAKELAWYRDWMTICMIGLLFAIFTIGSVLLITHVFTPNPWKILALTVGYLMVAIVFIFIEIKSIHVR